MRPAFCFVLLMLLTPVYAKVISYKTDNFADIATWYAKPHINPQTTLMVFDIDDTLITMTQDLGSVGWWDWQHTLMQHGDHGKAQVSYDLQHLARIQELLFNLIKMQVTDDHVLPFVSQVTAEGSPIIGLTGRSTDFLTTTFKQLIDMGFVQNNQLIFQQKGLQFNNNTSVAGAFSCPRLQQEITYQKGILFVSGADKGLALLCILDQAQQKIQTIFMIDDAPQNIDAVNNAFAYRNDVLLISVLYTREHAKEEAIRTNPQIQSQLMTQWEHIKNHINEVAINSYF